MPSPLRIGALISGGGTNLQAIIDACESGDIDGRMVFVGSDTPSAKGIERALKHNIPSFVVDYGDLIRAYRSAPDTVTAPSDFDLEAIGRRQRFFPAGTPKEKITAFLVTRAAAEAKLLAAMQPYPFDLLALAGFMRNLTPYFIDRVNTSPDTHRIMNIHPALLPAFPGTDGYGDTFRYGCKIGGCTVHFIDYGEDSGPIIGQKCFPILEDDTLADVKRKGLEMEWQLYPECIRLFGEDRLECVRRTFELDSGQTVSRTAVRIRPAKI